MDIARAPRSKRGRYVAWSAGLLAIVLATAAISRLQPSAPPVERGALWFDVVQRGEMRRDVRAPGTLVPEHVRIIAALTAGRVERLSLHPGDHVTAGTAVLELSNPDIELQALQAEQAVTAAQGAFANLRGSLAQQRLSQEAAIASLGTQYQAALRATAVQEGLDRKGLAARGDVEAARDLSAELKSRMSLERERLRQMQLAAAEQIRLDAEQIGRLRAIVQENRSRVSAMRVLASEEGVVQTLGDPPLELGQWVNSGVELARIAQPGRLKAVLRVPEGQAAEVAIGQRVSIDTRTGLVPGRVTRADPSSRAGTVTVEVALDGPLPAGTRADLSIEGTIEIERLPDVLHVGRPAYGAENATVALFRVEPNTGYARRVNVTLGRAAVSTIEIRGGLAVGDSVIVSDMSAWGDAPRVKLK